MNHLPIREMVLYKHGVGFFVRRTLTDEETITIYFNRDDINDVLKSLSAVDRNGHPILGVNY